MLISKLPLNGIKNIILDFGGVIIDIDYNATREAYLNLGFKDFDKMFSQMQQHPVFDKWDVGKIGEEEFFNTLAGYLPENTSRKEIIEAWNAMLGHFPRENFDLLLDLKKKYRTFLLSNTNETHIRYYFGRLKEWYDIENMDVFFEKTYYSHRVGMRKPDREIFRFLTRDNNLDPRETLFIDDSIQHVEGAAGAGLHAYHLEKQEKLGDALELLEGLRD